MYLDPYQSLGFHCSLTYKTFVNALNRLLKGTAVSPAQFVTLAHLIALGPISQAELANRLAITAATTVGLIDRMERDEWVIRKIDSNDSRVKLVILTKKAVRVWAKMSHIARDILKQAYKDIPPYEIERVMRVLAKVRKNLNE